MCVCVSLLYTACLLYIHVGVYLPLIWETRFCTKSAVALAYTRGHFSALVGMPSPQTNEVGAWSNRSGDSHVSYLPLVDSESRQLPLHFLSEEEVYSNSLRRSLYSGSPSKPDTIGTE